MFVAILLKTWGGAKLPKMSSVRKLASGRYVLREHDAKGCSELVATRGLRGDVNFSPGRVGGSEEREKESKEEWNI